MNGNSCQLFTKDTSIQFFVQAQYWNMWLFNSLRLKFDTNCHKMAAPDYHATHFHVAKLFLHASYGFGEIVFGNLILYVMLALYCWQEEKKPCATHCAHVEITCCHGDTWFSCGFRFRSLHKSTSPRVWKPGQSMVSCWVHCVFEPQFDRAFVIRLG